MKTVFALIISLFICVGYANAESSVNRTVSTLIGGTNGTVDIGVSGEANEFTDAFPMSFLGSDTDDIVFMYKATSDGTVSLTLYFEESYYKNITATTDSAYLTTQVLQSGLNDEVWHMATVDTVNGTYARVRILGGSGNDATTTIQIKAIK